MKNMVLIPDIIVLLVTKKPLNNGTENKKNSEQENGQEHLVLLALAPWKDVLGLMSLDIMEPLVTLIAT